MFGQFFSVCGGDFALGLGGRGWAWPVLPGPLSRVGECDVQCTLTTDMLEMKTGMLNRRGDMLGKAMKKSVKKAKE